MISMNKLLSEMDVLSSTQDGKDWVMKSLNPASPDTFKMMPDGGLMPRALQVFERTVTFSFAAAAANFNLDLLVHANPLDFCGALLYDGTTATFVNTFNTFHGANRGAALTSIQSSFEAYRFVCGSVTAIMDATSVTDSGLCAATQYLLSPNVLTWDNTETSYGKHVNRKIDAWFDPPKSYDSLVAMPGTYTGEAKDGCYLVLRAEDTQWCYTNRYNYLMSTDDAIAMGVPNVSAGSTPPVNATASWPFGCTGTGTATGMVNTLKSCTSNVGHIAFRNLNPAANIRVNIRMAFEVRTPPGTLYSTFLRIPPMRDTQALETYSRMSQKLALAYPASYNDWQKIVDVLADVAGQVLKFTPFAGLSPAVPLVRDAVKTGVSLIAAKRKAAKAAKAQQAAASKTKVKSKK